MNKGYVEIDHSGDIGIEASGDDMAELLENATRGLFGLVCRTGVEPVLERKIGVSSSSAEDLLVDWLGEVISLSGAFGELYGSVEVSRADEKSAEGVLRGERFDARKHDLRFDVKAATYHGLRVERRSNGYHARVIFDL